ncbi:hypothetical protein WDW89_11090 [Deltaproteobacteria bacterium TL4]
MKSFSVWMLLLTIFTPFVYGTVSEIPDIEWNTQVSSSFVYANPVSLAEGLGAFLQRYAKHPEDIHWVAELQGTIHSAKLFAPPQAMFEILLIRYDLSLIQKARQWWVVPKTEVWKHQPYQKWIASSVPVSEILFELSQVGKISIEANTLSLEPLRLHQNLDYSSVENAIEGLAHQFLWHVEYHAESHRITLIEEKQLLLKNVTLKHIMKSQLHEFLQRTTAKFDSLRSVEVVYPTESMVVLRGTEASTNLLHKLITEFDQSMASQSVNSATTPYFKTLILESVSQRYLQEHLEPTFEQYPSLKHRVSLSWGHPEATKGALMLSLSGEEAAVKQVMEILKNLEQSHQQLLRLQPPVFKRYAFRYLHVGKKMVQSEGQSMQVEGVELSLSQIFNHIFTSPSKDVGTAPKIIPDFVSNSIMVWATPEQLSTMGDLIQLWDKPSPLIKIEAYIFETSESFSQQLDLQYNGRGVSKGATIPNTPDSGPYSVSAMLGPLNTTQSFQVGTVLSFLEKEGKGRVLSRPVVVTTNNIEAEMHSGSIINVKIANENRFELKEIKTGVTLRVTPRLVQDDDVKQTNHKIFLNVYAETSNPLNENTDGIPQINSQRARSQVMVRNGEPFLLGGLIKNRTGQTETGIPFLKEIPLLGWLFRTTDANNQFDHILVFVTPSLLSENHFQKLPTFEELQNLKNIEN